MKKIIVLFIFTYSFLITSAQSNNPQDQIGIDFISLLQTIKSDFAEGRVTEINESSVSHYTAMLPGGLEASFEDVAAIAGNFKSSSFNLDSALNESHLSDFSKNILLDFAGYSNSENKNAYLEAIVIKVDSINEASLPNDEKKLMQSLAAITYHTIDSGISQRSGCWVTKDGVSTPAENCGLIGALAGGLVGTLICGIWPCGVIGAVVGAVIFSVS